MRKPFGTRGNAVCIPFSIGTRRIALPERMLCRSRGVQKLVVLRVVRRLVMLQARCAGVVRKPVVLIARCAGVIRRPVVRCDRYGQRDRMLGVVPDRGPLCRRDPRGAWFPIEARYAGVIPDARGSRSKPVVQAWFQEGVVGACW
jgi:hypothetical protein